MGEMATNDDITMRDNEWGMISEDPRMYESGVDNAVIEIVDTEKNTQKITFKKGGVLNLAREGDTIHLSWDDADVV